MNKGLSLLLIAVALLGLGNIAKAANTPATTAPACDCKIAVVDVNQVVSKSSQVQALKREQEAKMKELRVWLANVRKDVQNQSSPEAKQKLIQKYDAEFVRKQEAIKKSYVSKLESIDKNISAIITKEAKAKKYAVVIAKSSVLYGGLDITNDIKKQVK